MSSHRLFALILVGLLASGCKFVKTGDKAASAPAADETGDDARIAALIDKTYAAKLVPYVTSSAIAAGELKTALAVDLDGAGQKYGHRGAGEGGAWTFAVKGAGKVVASDRQSRAAHADVDVDGDGETDVVIQLGPVVRGSALRDVAPFYSFTDFRDQIEFAKLARALNDTAVKALKVPDGDLVGRTVTFAGAAALRSASDKLAVAPVVLEVAP